MMGDNYCENPELTGNHGNVGAKHDE